MKISIIMAVYNGELYIKDMIESILNQTYSNYKLYIHDDGSTDNTINICKHYMDLYSDKIELMTYNPEGTPCKNFMSMLKRIPYSDIIFFCDQDDIWLPNKIEKTIDNYNKINNNCPVLLFSDLKIVSSNLETIAASYLDYFGRNNVNCVLKNLMFEGIVPGCAMAINHAARKKILEYSDINNIYMHDWWAMQVIIATGGSIIKIEEQLILYRQHDKNCIGANHLSVQDKIKNNIIKIINGTLSKTKKERISRALNQFFELKGVSDINKETKDLIKRIEKILNENKLYRIISFWNIFKKVPNFIGLVFWI